MDAILKDGLQQAFAQFAVYLECDYDATKAMHDTAVDDGSTWPLNLGLLFLLGKAWPAYYATLDTDLPMLDVIRATIANLAKMDV